MHLRSAAEYMRHDAVRCKLMLSSIDYRNHQFSIIRDDILFGAESCVEESYASSRGFMYRRNFSADSTACRVIRHWLSTVAYSEHRASSRNKRFL